MKIDESNETSQGLTIRVSKPNTRYLNEFIKLKYAPDLLGLKLFPNVKEITESLTAWNAIRKYLGPAIAGREDIRCFDVGSGHTPRTAALIAHLTRWQCTAIDPELRIKSSYQRIARLNLFAGRIQEFGLAKPAKFAVVTAVHAHVNLSQIVKSIPANRMLLIAMPCCQPLKLPYTKPNKEYKDYGCWSPHRTVKIYDLYWF